MVKNIMLLDMEQVLQPTSLCWRNFKVLKLLHRVCPFDTVSIWNLLVLFLEYVGYLS